MYKKNTMDKVEHKILYKCNDTGGLLCIVDSPAELLLVDSIN